MDAREVLQLKTELETDWSGAQALMNSQLSFYELSFPIVQHDAFPPYRPPTGPSRVDAACDHILVGNEVITVPPRKETHEAQKQADKLEKFYQALAVRVDRTLSEPLLKQVAKLALIFGLGISKGPLWDPAVPDKPARLKGERKAEYGERIVEWEHIRRSHLPIKFHAVDPRQVLFPVGEYPLPYVIEVSTRKAGYVENIYGVSLPGKKPNETVEWIEYWDCHQRVYLADKQVVLPESGQANIGGFIPYAIVNSGFGRVPTYGGTHGAAEAQAAEALCRGLLFPVLAALREEAQLHTAIHTHTMLHLYPPIQVPEGFEHRFKWEGGPGGAIVVPEGVELKYLTSPPLSPELFKLVGELRREIENATFSGVLTGGAPPGIEAGYPLAILIGQARMKFGALIGNLERCREVSFGNVGRLVEALKESVTVFANLPDGVAQETLNAEDWNGHYELYCQLSGVSPEEADRRGMLGYNYWKGRGPDEPGISHQTFLERYAMLPDATGERAKILIERLMKSPAVQQVLQQQAVKEWAGIEIREALEAAEETPPPGTEGSIAGAGAGMPGLTPQPPGVPARPVSPGSPEELGTFMKKLQRLGGVAAQGEPIGGPREEV